MAGGVPVLDVTPPKCRSRSSNRSSITSVNTRALTLDEIRQKGIVLDGDDYLAFEFTLGLLLESKAVPLSMPVVFDRQGVAIPLPLNPPGAQRASASACPGGSLPPP